MHASEFGYLYGKNKSYKYGYKNGQVNEKNGFTKIKKKLGIVTNF